MPEHISRRLVSPDLLDFVDRIEAMEPPNSVQAAREGLRAMLTSTLGASPLRSETTINGRGGQLRMLVYRPLPENSTGVALMHLHGGGYTMGLPEMADARNLTLADRGIFVVSVDYRLAPEHIYPAALEDCLAALRWMRDNADDLDIDRDRIGVLGESAGGGLAAGLTIAARDQGITPAFQWLVYPMIDDRTGTTSDPHRFAGAFVWRADNNRAGWRALLGRDPGGDMREPYAAAARAEDLTGLPPTLLQTGALDLFVEENIDYARRLLRAGVSTELHVYPGAVHGFALLPQSQAAEAAFRDGCRALDRVLAGRTRLSK